MHTASSHAVQVDMDLSSSLDQYDNASEDMADALTELGKGDEWGRNIAVKKVASMKSKLIKISNTLSSDVQVLTNQKGIPRDGVVDIELDQVTQIQKMVDNSQAMIKEIEDFEHKIDMFKSQGERDHELTDISQKFKGIRESSEVWQKQEKQAEEAIKMEK